MILTGADVDAIAGLLHLRERQAFTIYASERVLAVLRANPIFSVLAEDCVRRQAVPLGQTFEPRHVDGSASGLEVALFDVPGKVALWLETGPSPDALAGKPGDTVGVEVRAGERRLLYIPGCAEMTDALKQRLTGASVVLFDGTLWQDDEMIRRGLGPKTGRRMGHMSVSGPDGTVAAFRGIPVERKIFVHINNSNPILVEEFEGARRPCQGGLGSGLRRHGGGPMRAGSDDRLRSPEELEAELRAIGAERYHHLHPFHVLLHGGKLTRQQVQAWALNRYYYQAMIPIKDAHALSRLPTAELRREWRRRIVDHDGDGPGTAASNAG